MGRSFEELDLGSTARFFLGLPALVKRHGEGAHNVAQREWRAAGKASEPYTVQNDPTGRYVDAELTPAGLAARGVHVSPLPRASRKEHSPRSASRKPKHARNAIGVQSVGATFQPKRSVRCN